MKLTLRLRFFTRFGQSLFVSGAHPLLGDSNPELAVPLHYLNHEFWEVVLDWPEAAEPKAGVSYHYILRNADGSLIHDWGNDRFIQPSSWNAGEVLILDSWNDAGAVENVFYTEPFQNVLLRERQTDVPVPRPPGATHTFKLKAPLLEKGQTLCLLGENAALGNWKTISPILLNRIAGEQFFSVQLDLSREAFPVTYKYGVYDVTPGVFVRYEDGENRTFHDITAPGRHTIVNDGFARLPTPAWKGAGVAIPVFSLRSEQSFGVGEFTDLKLVSDWAAEAGLRLIQILPVNDTSATHSWLDSYPYAAISAFALHPLYLNLSRVANGKNQKRLKKIEAERKRLNALEAVDYEAVMKAKLKFLKEIFPSQKGETFESAEYREFFEQNQHWLVPYAVFCFLRDKFGTADFNSWPAHGRYNADEVAPLLAKDSTTHDEIALHFFIQFHLHLQLREACEYAHGKGLIFKGDIAIGVYRHSADVWQEPELYHLNLQAGAPPDPFSAKGQNWGFPTYNWPRMKEDGFRWWKQRFGQMSNYFDAFRIDHILGFFRIWSIPAHAVEGILGYFVPAIPVRAEEFRSRGISFERERYVTPFITADVLAELFGESRELVQREFLVADQAGRYLLKPEFATQRQVERYFATQENSPANAAIRQGLFDLISNVILLEVAGAHGLEFHFRFAIENTSSFRHLDPKTQVQLRELYVDYFFRRQDEFWRREAMEKLPALKRVTNMLVCGEDLGLVPACVPEVMKQLGLLSLEIQRMPKQLGQEWSRPEEAPYLSVVTPATHDMNTIRAWWEEDRSFTQRFFNRELQRSGDAPEQCTPELNGQIVGQHLASPAMWSIFQLQDLLGMSESLRRSEIAAERINVPANPKHYWRYRMHLSLENLLGATAFNESLKRLIRLHGR